MYQLVTDRLCLFLFTRMLHSKQTVFAWPNETLDDLDSSFAVQEYLQQLIRQDRNNVERLIELPESVDREVWQYEHLR